MLYEAVFGGAVFGRDEYYYNVFFTPKRRLPVIFLIVQRARAQYIYNIYIYIRERHRRPRFFYDDARPPALFIFSSFSLILFLLPSGGINGVCV